MRPELVVGAGAALLFGALAGVEWWAEHGSADAVARPAEVAPLTFPETSDGDMADAASASPRLSR
jgi:hypothetical protein